MNRQVASWVAMAGLLGLVVVACGARGAWAAGLAAASPRQAAPAGGAANLLANGSFEKPAADGKNPEGWAPEKWAGEAAFEYAEGGRTGKRCVAMASEKGADAAWRIIVPVEPQAIYRLSGWIKTEDVKAPKARGALLNVHSLQAAATKAITGTKGWARVEVTFETGSRDSVQINCLLGGWGQATGKAWYDDIALEKLSGADWSPEVTIDAAREGPPISKYIYGQFIEHLGRCIYGGIWAEMLEDRKFFYPVGDKNSPWRALGGEGAVTMAKENAFVGAQTPRIAAAGDGAPRGIVQGGLGLRKGRQYVGRVWLAGDAAAAPVRVSLIWGEGDAGRQTVTVEKLAAEYARTPLRFTCGGDSDDGRLEIAAAGKGAALVGTASLMPADTVEGMRADTLELLRQLDSPVYRWPGGNFVSGYNWKDGIGDRDRRPPRKNPAWRGVEHNDFGLDEFMAFCRALKTEPYIALNSGLGQAAAAVEELQYVSAGPDTPMGKLRAANGHPEPYKVRYWGIGNEMYGGWQLGHIPLEKYVQKHNEFAKALRAADASAVLVGVGATGPWSEGMLKGCADYMDLLSEHFYKGEAPGLLGHVAQIPQAVRQKAEAHRKYLATIPELKGKDIRIALDEWNYWYGPHVFGELGTRYFLKDGLGIAAGIHEMARNSDMFFMANYAQTVNVIGCIKTSPTAAEFETTGLALMLYRRHYGTLPAATQSDAILDAQAAWAEGRKSLTIGIVNPTMRRLDVPVKVSGAKLTGAGRRWQIAGDDPMAFNDPGKPRRVTIEESSIRGFDGKLAIAPCSVTLVALDAEPSGGKP